MILSLVSVILIGIAWNWAGVQRQSPDPPFGRYRNGRPLWTSQLTTIMTSLIRLLGTTFNFFPISVE